MERRSVWGKRASDAGEGLAGDLETGEVVERNGSMSGAVRCLRSERWRKWGTSSLRGSTTH